MPLNNHTKNRNYEKKVKNIQDFFKKILFIYLRDIERDLRGRGRRRLPAEEGAQGRGKWGSIPGTWDDHDPSRRQNAQPTEPPTQVPLYGIFNRSSPIQSQFCLEFLFLSI